MPVFEDSRVRRGKPNTGPLGLLQGKLILPCIQFQSVPYIELFSHGLNVDD